MISQGHNDNIARAGMEAAIGIYNLLTMRKRQATQ